MRINSNIPSLTAYNALNATSRAMQKSVERLSTGLRINSASDDAAGLAISEKMRAQMRGIDQAVSNAQDGISMIRTAEGAMNESHSILQRMRELSVQAANDTLTMNDREFIQLEVDQLKEELDRIATTTQFNKKKLLDGSADALWSADLLGTKVFVNGSTLSKDQFGQTVKLEGNFKVEADVVKMGQNQVLKSNIFMVGLESGEAVVAGVNSQLSDMINFIDGNGVNILEQPQSLTISVEGGGSSTFSVYSNDSLGDLGEKLSNAIAEASELKLPGGSGVQYVWDGVLPPNPDDPMIVELASNALWGAANRIQEALGLLGLGGELTINIRDDFSGAVMAYATGSPATKDGMITIFRQMFMDENGFLEILNLPGEETFQRIITHELVHAVTLIDEGINAGMGSKTWLVEGIAEYVHGANERVRMESSALVGGVSDIEDVAYGLLTAPPAVSPPGAYSAAYLLVRYLDEQSIANGGGGIREMFGLMSGGETLGEAMEHSSNGAFTNEGNLATVVNGTNRTTAQNINGVQLTESFEDFVNRVIGEDSDVDTGAIGGSYVTGDPANAKGPVDIVAGNGVLSANPLANFGWSGVIWPSGVSVMLDNSKGSLLSSVAPKEGTLQAVDGTLLLHSAIAGLAGRISISGDEDLIKALGFAEIQSASDTIYDLRISDAHTGDLLVPAVRISGGTMYGVLHENIDIRLINNFAIALDARSLRTDGYGSYIFEESGRDEFTVHIAAASVVLQIGANQGENMFISFGDISSAALGVDKVSVRDRELAARAVTIIDSAIGRVSTKRARLGAYQNRLEHTITNLTATSANTTAAMSRISDADMAKEMINFTRLSILSEAGVSMLGQANQLPQNVLMLLG